MNDDELQREKRRLGQGRESWGPSSSSPASKTPMPLGTSAGREEGLSASAQSRESSDAVVLQQNGSLRAWLWCVMAGVLAGAAVIGANLARGALPWSGLQALKDYVIAPVLLLLLIHLEREAGGHPATLLGRLIFPILVATTLGWCAVAFGLAQRLAHLVSV